MKTYLDGLKECLAFLLEEEESWRRTAHEGSAEIQDRSREICAAVAYLRNVVQNKVYAAEPSD